MASEITEEDDEGAFRIDKEAEKIRIRRIIEYQKSTYRSPSCSSSFSSASASTSSFSSSRKSTSLMDLMKGGSTSLGRLFDMEHTSLGNYLRDFSVSTIVKPVPLWGSDSDDALHDDPWVEMKQMKDAFDSLMNGQAGAFLSNGNEVEEVSARRSRIERMSKRKLYRARSYKRLPSFGFWKCGAFRFRFRFKLIKRLRVMIRGRKM